MTSLEPGPLPFGMRPRLSRFAEEFGEPDEPGDAGVAAATSSVEPEDIAPWRRHVVTGRTSYPTVDVPPELVQFPLPLTPEPVLAENNKG